MYSQLRTSVYTIGIARDLGPFFLRDSRFEILFLKIIISKKCTSLDHEMYVLRKIAEQKHIRPTECCWKYMRSVRLCGVLRAATNTAASLHHPFRLRAENICDISTPWHTLGSPTVPKMDQNMIWIDTDCGFDDLCAISLLDDYSRRSSDKLTVGFISTVNGMTNPKLGVKVIGKMFQSDGFHCKPTVSCGYESLSGQKHSVSEAEWGPEYVTNFSVFFSSFVGENLTITTDMITQQKLTTIDNMVKQIKSLEKGQKVTLLCLGPLTNIANIIRRHPSFLSERVERLVLMGGAVLVGGNGPGGAEYNFYFDPASAEYVLKNCSVPIEMCGLEVANDTALTPAEYHRILTILNSKSTDVFSSSITESSNGSSADGSADDPPSGGVEGSTTGQSVSPKTCVLSQGFSAREFLWTIAATSREALCYDSIVSYYLIRPDAFTFDRISIVVDVLTGRTIKTSPTDNCGVQSSDSIDIHLSTSLLKDDYFNYLMSSIYK